MSHAKLSPSSAHRWMECPGSVALNAMAPRTDTKHSREGTFAHEVAEKALRKSCSAFDLIGMSNGEFQCDKEMAEHVQTYLDVVNSLRRSRRSLLTIESKVFHAEYSEIFGTADAVLIDRGDFHVVDLKYGAGVLVDVRENAQLLTYAVCAMHTHVQVLDTVTMHIVQPRHQFGGHVSETISARELIEWDEEVLRPAAQRVLDGDDELVPGSKQCNWCAVKATCPALNKKALAEAKDIFDAHPVEGADFNPELLDDTELAKALQMFPLLEQWIKAVKEHAHKRASDGHEIPGYRLTPKRGHRQWSDPEAAKLYLEMMGVDPHVEAKLISPAQAEKRLPGKTKVGVNALTETRSSGTNLVPSESESPEYSPADAFLDHPYEDE